MGCKQSKDVVETEPVVGEQANEAAVAEVTEALVVAVEEAAVVQDAVDQGDIKVQAVEEEDKPVVENAGQEEEPVEEEAKPEAEAAEEDTKAEAGAVTGKEPETEVKPVEEPEVDPAVQFEATGVTYDDANVAFYTFKGVSKDDPTKEFEVHKRYSEFKALHDQLTADWSGKPLPALPNAGVVSFFRGRKNKSLAAQREAAFLELLDRVSRNPAAFESEAFQQFVAVNVVS